MFEHRHQEMDVKQHKNKRKAREQIVLSPGGTQIVQARWAHTYQWTGKVKTRPIHVIATATAQ